MFLCSNALSLCGIALIPLASSGLRARLCVQQQNLCTRHTTGTKCEEKEKERMVFDPFGQKSTSEKRKTQEKEKMEKGGKKPKKKKKSKKGGPNSVPLAWKKDAFRLSNFTSS